MLEKIKNWRYSRLAGFCLAAFLALTFSFVHALKEEKAGAPQSPAPTGAGAAVEAEKPLPAPPVPVTVGRMSVQKSPEGFVYIVSGANETGAAVYPLRGEFSRVTGEIVPVPGQGWPGKCEVKVYLDQKEVYSRHVDPKYPDLTPHRLDLDASGAYTFTVKLTKLDNYTSWPVEIKRLTFTPKGGGGGA